jgi:hypothetical protein
LHEVQGSLRGAFLFMASLMRGLACRRQNMKNKENQFIDFRLMITKEEKPRFFLLCLQFKGSLRGAFFVFSPAGRRRR